MDFTLGAMGSLLPKLGELLTEEYKMQTSVKRDIEAFSRELASMRAALHRVAEVPRDQLDEEVKLWAGDVRELSYDTEDVVDSLLVRVKGTKHDADMDGFKELMRKMANLFKKGKARRQIAKAMKDIKEQVQDVAARHERYKADGVFANLAAATRVTIDPLLVALFEDKRRLVGIETARDELIEKLCFTDDASKQPKILSIVGFGGLGKTTLAKAIYDKVKSDFDCTAFVSVSRSPDIREVLRQLLFEVDRQKCTSLSGVALNEKQLIEQLQESLGAKRYFIVVDDIWDVSAWKTIRYALMGSECGSRIITTTRIINISKECSSYNDDMVHNMKPLSDGDSQRLFYKRIFPGNNMCPPALQEVSMNILKKCAGVPLAIITLASYLASNQQVKPISEWYVLLNSIGSGIRIGDTNLEEMRRILSFSYYDLPSHLKNCLLYLSIFPEDHKIDRDRLIRRWIAEGFIQGNNLFELGRSYFNELINRSMIQPFGMDLEGEPDSCLVHDIMLDLICDLASEENFVTIMDVIKLDMPFERKVRRLSIQKADLTNTWLATSTISQVRSFTIFSPAINQMLPISRFEVLRVLDLEGCNYLGHLNLSSIRKVLEESGHLNLSSIRKESDHLNLSSIRKESGHLNLSSIRNVLAGSGHLNLGSIHNALEESSHLNLSSIGDLLHLRYLGLRNTKLRKIPMGIGKLLFLQTLDLRWGHKDANELPASVVQLRSLMYLYVSAGTYLPAGYKNLKSLQELSRPHFTQDGDPEELGYLTELRVLEFNLPSGYPPEKLLILLESVDKLQKLQSLHIASDGGRIDNLGDWVPSSPQLRILRLLGWHEMMPTRINASSLPLVSYLDICVYKVRLADIQVLGTLPTLRTLQLHPDMDISTEEEHAMERSFMLSPDAFPRLRVCNIQCVLFAPYMFPRGAMAMVQKLYFGLLVADILGCGDWDLCIRNLPSLEFVAIKLFCDKASRGRYHEAKAAVQRAVADHPNRPEAHSHFQT